ncbi:MAG: mannitol/fructose-specific phosphotransferase system IIA component (Ntr-type) [Candidatus Binatia bacterium]|jgi:mannitol/fructose-specific phosphotransferase system IIA component (Ntr-type)
MIAAPVSASTFAMELQSFTTESLMQPRLSARSPADAIRLLAAALRDETDFLDGLSFYQCALHREFCSNTYLGGGVAVPHASVTHLKAPIFALATLSHPIVWGASKTDVARVVFLFAIRRGDTLGRLRLLAAIAQFAKSPDGIEAALTASDSSALYGALPGETEPYNFSSSSEPNL